jgi:RHH-type proline utilization regulon transcriptional repressor/proline dehydrogenase/delta 1-pyrroline-5-carboxylate dehydrogenase
MLLRPQSTVNGPAMTIDPPPSASNTPTPPAGNDVPAELRRAIELAAALQKRAIELQTSAERRQQADLDRMLQSPTDKSTLTQMTDQAFRSKRAERMAEQLVHILDVQGVPRFFGPVDRTMLKGFQSFADYVPGVAMPLVEAQIRKETANVILPTEPELLAQHLADRRAEGVRMNVNLLGEAILGEREAQRRLAANLRSLQMPEIEVMSVKISTMYSQISALAREHTVQVLCDRMEMLYRSAARLSYVRPDGTRLPKFIYLDMEEYRDMDLTAEVFMRTLDRPGMEAISAGIVLQAYIPDSFAMLQRLHAWARRRLAAGGASITIRLVKGANMEMERVEAAIRGWPQAPYRTKRETDANYKRMVQEGMKTENLAAVRLGIASHNLLDVSYALTLAADAGALDRVQFEMLEGMANHQRRALFERTHNLLLYAPACGKEDFLNAVGYLIRRLDENTGPENFLRHAFKLNVGDAEWQRLVAGFCESFRLIPSLDSAPRRTQDRSRESTGTPKREMPWDRFVNEPDTDFALPANGEWARSLLERWQSRCGPDAADIALVVDGEAIVDGRTVRECEDPSRPGVAVGRYRQADGTDVERAVACAKADPDGWRRASVERRSAVLGQVAQNLREARADLIGAAVANGGKTILEADPEVSEAIDFCEFYRAAARMFFELPGVHAAGKGVVVVVSPWNFPIAIPCGGIAAALAAGNTVIFKPASDTVLVAWELCRCFWRAGVSKRTLQFVPCAGAGPGRALVSNGDVDAVILTGGTETALSMLRDAPAMHLYAETGGKNATIVTGMADREQAIKHVVHSAFSHGGQKCSATSLLLLEAEVYDDPEFRRMLCDAAESIQVGSAWRLDSRMGPLIRPPSGDLETSLKTLEAGESWALLPRRSEDNPRLWTPGIKWGVRPGSYTHLTEFFGPVLGVMRFENLNEAIALVNQTGYGLTSGLETLDDREQETWKAGIRAGNLYVNRPTTGAIVLRQPFGGMGKSCYGPGMKAGGPNYVAQLMQFASRSPGTGQELIATALAGIDRACAEEFRAERDHFRLLGQDNFRRYLPVPNLKIRAHPDDSEFDLAVRVAAAAALGCRPVVSVPGDLAQKVRATLAGVERLAGAEVVLESDADLVAAILGGSTDRLRFGAPDRVGAEIRAAAAATGTCICDAPVVGEARVELLWYVQEQSISIDYHRYGNLGTRADEARVGPD